MTDAVSIALAQINLLVGDIAGNAARVVEMALRARDGAGCQAVVFPELTLTGYPPEDLVLRPAFNDRVERMLADIAPRMRGITAVVGHTHRRNGRLYNAASVIADGRVTATYCKQILPNYSVFDEKRYFHAGSEPCVFQVDGLRAGVLVCEDTWEQGPYEQAVAAGAQAVFVLNASPYHMGKGSERESIVAARVREGGVPLAYVNLVGGQDELVFDGSSFVLDGAGNVVVRGPEFVEDLTVVRFRTGNRAEPVPGTIQPYRPVEESVYAGLVLGVRDYIGKNRFPGAVLGLSGGIDSALTLCIAVDAIGAPRVEAVLMPSRYTADMSIDDARLLADALGVRHRTIPIEPMFQAFLTQLAPVLAGRPPDATEENLQARCRGVLLMAISNRTGSIVLTTGNKSEMSVGYATLYGDMAGGFSAIKDVPKTLVYRLAEYRNRLQPAIPRRIIERPPTAELRPGQKDEDSLPPYAILDPILERYIEDDRSPEAIIAEGFDAETVRRVTRMVDRNEYKRRQAAPGVRITRRAFGRDRRYPITSGAG